MRASQPMCSSRTSTWDTPHRRAPPEVVANGLPAQQGAQATVDVTLFSPVARDGTAHARCAAEPGAAATDAAAGKRCEIYPEFAQAPQLAVLALETGGRRDDDCEHFLRVLAAGRAQAHGGRRAALPRRPGRPDARRATAPVYIVPRRLTVSPLARWKKSIAKNATAPAQPQIGDMDSEQRDCIIPRHQKQTLLHLRHKSEEFSSPSQVVKITCPTWYAAHSGPSGVFHRPRSKGNDRLCSELTAEGRCCLLLLGRSQLTRKCGSR